MSFVDDFAEINKDLNKLEADKAPKQEEEAVQYDAFTDTAPSEILYVSPPAQQVWHVVNQPVIWSTGQQQAKDYSAMREAWQQLMDAQAYASFPLYKIELENINGNDTGNIILTRDDLPLFVNAFSEGDE